MTDNFITRRPINLDEVGRYKKVFLVDGFHRQGNTFLQFAVNYCLSSHENLVIGRTHSDTEIDSLPKSAVIISPTRNPLETIPSWLLKSGIKPEIDGGGNFSNGSIYYAKSEIRKYIKISNYILKRSLEGQAVVVPFYVLSKDVYKVLSYIFELTGTFCSKRLPWPNTNKFFIEMMAEKNKNMIANNIDVWNQHGYIPRARPDYFTHLEEMVLGEDFADLMEEALMVHKLLVQSSPWPNEDTEGW